MKLFSSRFISENKYLLIISFLNFLLIYLSTFVKGYGYFIDEFYYIACANRPAFGYVDHPPLAPLILTIFQFFFGDSLYAIRILPALAVSGSVFLSGIITKEIGGGRFAQCLAACAVAASPMFVAFGGFYSMNAYEPLLAITILFFTIKMINENNPKRWIVIGIFMGLGMMNKHTFAVFIAALVFALLVSGKWKLILNRWFAAGAILAVIIFLPNVIWQILNDYPSLEFYKNISTYKNIYTPPLAFFLGQLLEGSPSTFSIWLAGIIFLLFSKNLKNFRFLSILFLTLFFFMMISGTSRADRMAFAYPAVFAGGAFFFENFIQRFNLRWLKVVLIASLYAGLAIALPVILPYFNYEQVASYTKFMGLNTEIERGKKPPLPQLIADKIGWEEKFNLVLRAYQSLPEQDKKRAIIACGNYGQAGAVELFGKKYNLPPVVAGHNTYYLWTKDLLVQKGDTNISVILQVGKDTDIDVFKERIKSVEVFPGKFSNPYVSSHENNLRVFFCRNPKMSYAELVEKGKFYY